MADDHLNVAVASNGTLYAAVKTSYDTAGYPKIALLIRRPNGTWDPLYEVDQSGTRGIVLLNEQDHTVRVVYTSSEGFNDIVTKKSSTSSIAFGSRSTLLTGGVNDVTSTKQNWSGKVPVMAASASTAYTAFITADTTVGGSAVADSTVMVIRICRFSVRARAAGTCRVSRRSRRSGGRWGSLGAG